MFTLPTAVFGVCEYARLKVFGVRYVLTNRAVQRTTTLGGRVLAELPLEQIAEVAVFQSPGQRFYKSADLELMADDESPLMRLEGIKRAEVFRQTILKTRDARVLVESSLAQIQSRQPA